MQVIPRKGLDKDELIPYIKLVLGDCWEREVHPILEGYMHKGGYIPSEAYPLKVIHADSRGYLILLLDERDHDSTIIAGSVDFDFIESEVTDGKL